MTPNGQFWQPERRYLGTERIMQRGIYPGTNVGIPDTSRWNIWVGVNIIIRGLFPLCVTAGSKQPHLTHRTSFCTSPSLIPPSILPSCLAIPSLYPLLLFFLSPRNSDHFTFRAYFTILAHHRLHRLDPIRYQCFRQWRFICWQGVNTQNNSNKIIRPLGQINCWTKIFKNRKTLK